MSEQTFTAQDLKDLMDKRVVLQPAPAQERLLGNILEKNMGLVVTLVAAFFALQAGLFERDGVQNVDLARMQQRLDALEHSVSELPAMQAQLAAIGPSVERIELAISRMQNREILSRSDVETMIAPIRQNIDRNTDRLDTRTDFMSETRSRLTRLESKSMVEKEN